MLIFKLLTTVCKTESVFIPDLISEITCHKLCLEISHSELRRERQRKSGKERERGREGERVRERKGSICSNMLYQ